MPYRFSHKHLHLSSNFSTFAFNSVCPQRRVESCLLVKGVYERYLPRYKSRKFDKPKKIRQQKRLRWVYYIHARKKLHAHRIIYYGVGKQRCLSLGLGNARACIRGISEK